MAVVDQYKSAKGLVHESGARQPERDIRLGAFGYFQESLVFYAERRVERGVTVEVPGPGGPPQRVLIPFTADTAAEFLSMPPAGDRFLFVPAEVWDEQVKGKVTVPCRVVARRYDFYRNADILVVVNESARPDDLRVAITPPVREP